MVGSLFGVRGSASKRAPSYHWQVDTGCWQEPSISFHWTLWMSSWHWQLASPPEGVTQERASEKSHFLLQLYLRSYTLSLLHYIIGFLCQPDSIWGGLHNGKGKRRHCWWPCWMLIIKCPVISSLELGQASSISCRTYPWENTVQEMQDFL